MRNASYLLGHGLLAITIGAIAAGCNGKAQQDSQSTTAPVTTSASVSQLVLLSGSNQTGTVGSQLAQPIQVLAQDAEGNPMADVQVMFQVTVDALGQGQLGGSLSTTSAVTGTDGIAETSLTLSTTAGGNHIRALAPDLGSQLLISNFGVAGPATSLALETGDGQTTVVGTPAAAPLVVKVTDSFGNPAPDVAVAFEVTTGDATVSQASVVTDAGGLAQVVATAGTTAGLNMITAAAAGVTAQPSFALTGTPDVPAALTIASGDAQSAVAGTALPAPFVVLVADQYKNPIADAQVAFAVTAGGGTLSAATAATAVDGTASTILTLGATATTNTVTATVTGVTPVTFTATGTAGAATTIAIVSGDNQTGVAGAPLAAPLVVSVVDANNNAVADFMVQFTVLTGNGTLAQAAVPTNAQGQAQVAYTLGLAAGPNQVQATGTGIKTPVLFNSLGTAGPAAIMQIASGNNQTGLVSTALKAPFVVLVTDKNGNPVQNTQVAFAITAGGGKLSATTVATNAQGQAASTLTLGATPVTNTVTASSGNLTGSPSTFTATATAGAATQIALTSGDKQTGVAGSPLAQPFVITVRDVNNNPVPNFMVSFAVATGGGKLSASTVATNAQGQASTILTLGTVAGPNTVTCTATGLTGSPVTFSATGNTGPAAKMALVSGNNQSATVNTLLPQALVVKVSDANDNPVQGTTVLWSVAAGGGTLSATSSVTDANGQTSIRYTLGATATTNTVQASSGNLSGSPVSFNATATASAATTLALVSGDKQSGVAGAPLANMIVVKVTDANNVAVPNFTVGFAIAQGNGAVSAASQMTNSMGLAMVSWTLGKTAGPNSLTVTASGLTGSPMTLTATGTAGPAAKLAIASGNNQSAAVATKLAQPLVVVATDANDNPVAGVSVAFAVTAGGGSLSAATATTGTNGQASTELTLGATATTNTVTASSTGLTGSPSTFTATATALPATTLAMSSGNNQTGVAGTALAQPFVVKVTDKNGGPVAGFTVGFAVATGGGSLSAATAKTDAQGLASSTLTLGAAAGTNTVTITATGLAGSPMTFTATGTAGAAAKLVIDSGDKQSGIAGSALAKPLVVKVTDANDNPVAGATVAFKVSAGGGSVNPASAASNTTGLAQTALTLGATPSTNTVTATVTGVTPVTFTATGMAAPASAVSIVSGDNQSARIRQALTDPLVIKVTDANNNPLSGQTVAFTVVTGGGVLSAASATTNAQGQASVSYSVGPDLGANTVRAAVTGLTPADFTAMGTALTYVDDLKPVLTAKCAGCHTAGYAFGALTTYDQVRNGVTLLKLPFVVPFDPANSAIVQKTMTGGTMNAYAGTDAQLISDWVRTGAINGAAALPPSVVAVSSGNNQSAQINTALAQPLVVVVTDANNNAVSGVTVNWAVTAGGGTLSAATSTTDLLGLASVNLTVGATATTNTVTATVSGLTPATFNATATAGFSGAPLAGSTNPLDVAALSVLKANNLEPSGLSTDDEFLRRVTGDLVGRLPSASELAAFEADNSVDKRAKVIDAFLASQEFIDHWGELLAVWVETPATDKETVNNVDVTYNFDTELRQDLANGATITDLLTKMINSTGDVGNAFRHRHSGSNQSDAIDVLGTAFMGMSVRCGRCHDHKLTGANDDPRWTQAQVYGLYAFVSNSSRYGNPFWVGDGTGNRVDGPAYDGANNIAARRQALVNVLTTSPVYYRATAHRIWSEIAAPLLNPNEFLASNIMAVKSPALLDALRDTFAAQNTSLQGFLRVAMNSKLYQLTSAGADTAADPYQGRYVLRRNAGLVLEHGIHQIADVAYQSDSIFRANFGFADRNSITSREDATSSDQALMLLNSSRARAITDSGSQIAALANSVDGGALKQIIPSTSLISSSGAAGLDGVYYNTMDFSGPAVLTRVDKEINFSYGSGSPDPAVNVDKFSIVWTGKVRIVTGGAYTFLPTTDDGVRLTVDGQVIINQLVDQGPTETSGTINLTAGDHDIKMEYYENGGGAVAQLRWSSPALGGTFTYQDAVTTIVRAALGRNPTAAEMTAILAERDPANTRASLEDVAVGVAASAEFVFRR